MTFPSEAEEVLKKYATTCPVSLLPIVKDYNIDLQFIYRPHYSGRIFQIENGRYRIECNALHPRTRQRFTVAHELGHFFMDKDLIHEKSVLEDNALYRSKLPTKREVRANRFAADLLMPMHVIEKIIDDATQNIKPKDIANLFNVSEQAIRIQLGIL